MRVHPGRASRGIVACGLALFAAACGGDKSTGPDPDDLSGTWVGVSNLTGTLTIEITQDDPRFGLEGSADALADGMHFPATVIGGSHDRSTHELLLEFKEPGSRAGPATLYCHLEGIPSIGCTGTLVWNFSGTNTTAGQIDVHMRFVRQATP